MYDRVIRYLPDIAAHSNSRIVLIAGTTGSGKSIVTSSLCKTFALRNYRCAYFSSEIPTSIMTKRLNPEGLNIGLFKIHLLSELSSILGNREIQKCDYIFIDNLQTLEFDEFYQTGFNGFYKRKLIVEKINPRYPNRYRESSPFKFKANRGTSTIHRAKEMRVLMQILYQYAAMNNLKIILSAQSYINMRGGEIPVSTSLAYVTDVIYNLGRNINNSIRLDVHKSRTGVSGVSVNCFFNYDNCTVEEMYH